MRGAVYVGMYVDVTSPLPLYTAPVTLAVFKRMGDGEWRSYLLERCKLRSRSYFYYLSMQVAAGTKKPGPKPGPVTSSSGGAAPRRSSGSWPAPTPSPGG